MKRKSWLTILITFKNWSLFEWLMFAMVVCGVGLGVFQYLIDRDIWLDESSLILNILESSYSDLLKPMKRNQVAPIGYLWLTKFVTQVFGNSTYALRAPSILAYLLSIFLTYRLGVKLTKSAYIGLCSAAILASSFTFINFANEVKQYSVDIAVCLLLIQTTASFQYSRHSLTKLFLVGFISILLSNVSSIVLVVCGIEIIRKQVFGEKRYRVMIPMVGWLVIFGGYFFFFIHDHPTQVMMKSFWEKYFFTESVFSAGYWSGVFSRIENSFTQILGLNHWSNWIFYSSVLLGSIWLVVQKRFGHLWLLIGCVMIHVVLSTLELYPYYIRLIIYQVAPVIVLSQLGFSMLLKSEFIVIRMVASSLMLTQPIYAMANTIGSGYPIHRAEITEALDTIIDRQDIDIPLYLYYIPGKAFEYYTNYRGVEIQNPIIRDKSHRADPDKYLDKINSFRGLNWMYFTGVYPFNRPENEMTLMIDHITSNGGEVIEEYEFYSTSYLYLVRFYPSDSLLKQ